ncbi:ATP-dependent DNA helicase [Parvularcula maris]|uniref:ATP-dependent RecD-like DNA helicase n=1 Tax=Parvularcula maris TaxID=2965077 RepID=A0A9X2L9L1_9PROT|nr:AAA family ATPase [Parvularcula maris]MCQ8185577.1 ATP-dependent RecD-like DNA helicase [Parvularcula maris]
MKWSPQQDDALLAASRWLKKRDDQVFRLFGYAGTGKTTLAKEIAQQADGNVVFGAYTGKAAHVLRQKGCDGAKTIHSLIYRPAVGEDEDTGESPTFTIRRDAPAGEASLIIIDECSMVDEELGRDLLSFGAPVLVLGDPAQLPPVKGGGFFTDAEPDVMLTEVHRQAEESGIVRLSMQIREGEVPKLGDYGEAQVISKRELDPDQVLETDQVLVGTNRTRRRYNERLRERQGYEGELPSSGERLVCLRNNKQKGLLNGSMWEVKMRSPAAKNGKIKMSLLPEDGGRVVRATVLADLFSGDAADIPWQKKRGTDEFDYGYALTVHKAQGSQWDDVVLFDESWAFKEHKMAWLYTGVTRAAKKLTLVR